MKKQIVPFLAMLAASALFSPARSAAQMPVTVGEPMPDFSLPVIQGGQFTLSALRGKNLLLVFPRGRVGDHWCQICHYQYAELVDLEQRLGIRERCDLEIVFVLPYDRAMVEEWTEIFPEQMAVIEGWKNPSEDDTLTDSRRRWATLCREYFPKTFAYGDRPAPIPFPILVDADRTLSKRLGLFTTDWDRSQVDQNIPTIFILDGEGVVQFKYHSQTTFDRPGPDYLMTVTERLIIDD